jgi:hypothetical protein
VNSTQTISTYARSNSHARIAVRRARTVIATTATSAATASKRGTTPGAVSGVTSPDGIHCHGPPNRPGTNV